jgi:NADH:ubiquinone oxidoreductase subunit D
MLRSTGVLWDLRKKKNYEVYPSLRFSVPISFHGDCYDRYLLRVEELRQSNYLVSQCINNMAQGLIKIENFKVIPPSRKIVKKKMESLIQHFKLYSHGFTLNFGENYTAVEAPKGEFGVYLVSHGGETPFRCKIKSPGFLHLQSINTLAKGHLIADVVTIIGTLDLVFGEIDR